MKAWWTSNKELSTVDSTGLSLWSRLKSLSQTSRWKYLRCSPANCFSKWLIKVICLQNRTKKADDINFNYRVFSAVLKSISHSFNGCKTKHQTLPMLSPSGSRACMFSPPHDDCWMYQLITYQTYITLLLLQWPQSIGMMTENKKLLRLERQPGSPTSTDRSQGSHPAHLILGV